MDDNSKLRYEQAMKIVQEHVSVMQRLLRTIFEGEVPSVPHIEADQIAASARLLSPTAELVAGAAHVDRSRLEHGVETPAPPDKTRYGKVCIRCFNLWKTRVQAEEDIPDCVFIEGGRRKKCQYCSTLRSQCVAIPQSITKTMMIQKHQMDTMAKEGHDHEVQRRKFTESYWDAAKQLQKRPVVQQQDKRKRDQQRQKRAVKKHEGTNYLHGNTVLNGEEGQGSLPMDARPSPSTQESEQGNI
ncbi:unnamed protein product [Penicillium glandicola]